MRLRDKLLIMNYFKEYYHKYVDKVINDIQDIEAREFAFIDFEGVMRRHIALKKEYASRWIIEVSPRDFYHSSAYYLFPEKEMGQKDWQGGDLIFDIDLDHIKTYQPKEIIICEENGHKVVKSIEDCGSGRIRKIVFIDEKGINKTKKEVVRLIEILIRDFDFKTDNLKIYFSGGRGFHLHINREDVLKLDSYTRMELKDYITLDGFDILNVNSLDNRVVEELRRMLSMRDEILYTFFTDSDVKELASLFNTVSSVRSLKKMISKELRYKINQFVVEYIGISIDGVVTVDTSRLIRVPYSLHGKTGLIKKHVEYTELDDFNPFTDAIREDECMMKLYVTYLPEIYWLNREYGPIYDDEVTVPFSLGVYLISRGLGYGGKRC